MRVIKSLFRIVFEAEVANILFRHCFMFFLAEKLIEIFLGCNPFANTYNLFRLLQRSSEK